MRILCTTVMRNEGPFILEWLAYHRRIGVTDFLIYTNDCEDGTDALLDRLQEMGLVAHLDNPRSGRKTVQWKALSRARNHALTSAADWILVTDVDEFLCIHAGDGHIRDLLAARPDAVGFAIDWRMFGNNGRVRFEDMPVMRQFTRAAPEALLWPWRAVQFKSFYRTDPDRYDKLGVHRPSLRDDRSGWHGWVGSSGSPLGVAPGTVALSSAPRYELAQINHYALGSVQNFLVKAARGKPNHSTDAIDLAYWSDRNFNTVEETSILRHADAVAAQVAEWRQDPVLDRLHRDSVRWRLERIEALLQESDPFYQMARILQMPPTAVLPPATQNQLLSQLFRIRRRIAAEKKQPR